MQSCFNDKANYEGARKLMKDFLNDKIDLKIKLSGQGSVNATKTTGLENVKNKIAQYAEEYKLSIEPKAKANEKNLQANNNVKVK